jgi:hypothetical protein
MQRWKANDAKVVWPLATLLGRLRPVARVALLQIGTPVGYSAERVILRQGDSDQHVVLLLDGLVKVTTVAARSDLHQGDPKR